MSAIMSCRYHRVLSGQSCAGRGSLRPFVKKQEVQPARQMRMEPVMMGRRAAKNALRKGKSDALKAKLWGKYGKLVLQAAKNGDPDPGSNKALAVVIESARKAGVPRDIIDRNMKRAADKDAGDLTEALYEVYAPGGTGFVMECLTDNTNRAHTEIWTVVKKLNGKMAESGSVMFNFERRGELVIKGISEDDAFDAALEAGGEDVEPFKNQDDGEVLGYTITCASEEFGKVRDSLGRLELEVCAEVSGLAYHPLSLVEIEDDDAHHANEEMYERLLQLDDVDAIFSTGAGIGKNPEA